MREAEYARKNETNEQLLNFEMQIRRPIQTMKPSIV